jgi:amino acid adenylation domain-containing protein
LYQTLLAGSDALYRTQSRDNIHGSFDADLFRRAIAVLVDRHECLRCLFLHTGLDEPAAIVQERTEIAWVEHDLSHYSQVQQQTRLDAIAVESFNEPLPLDKAPLLRITMVRLSSELTQIIFDIHHLIFDGWSSVVFFSELQSIYYSLQSGLPVQLPAAGKFSDYAITANAPDKADTQAYWQEQLKGFDRPTPLPFDNDVADDDPNAQFTNASFRLALDSATSTRLAELARMARVTLNTLIEAAWALTLCRYNNTDDVVIGLTLNGRSSALQEHANTFGMFVSALPLRLRCASRDNLFTWLQRLQAGRTMLNRYENVSAAEIHQASDCPAGIALFNALLVYQTFPTLDVPDDPPLRFSNVGIHENNPIPLVIDIFDRAELEFLVMHNDRRLPDATVRQLMGHFLNILYSMATLKSPAASYIQDLQMLSPEDIRVQLHEWNSPPTNVYHAQPQTLHEWFLRQAEKTPQRLAVTDGQRELSYAELADSARQLSGYLFTHGVGQGDVVALCLPRSIDWYPAMLAVMMTGAMFLPVDPAYPSSRQHYMLTDSRAKLVLVNGATNAISGASVPVINLQTDRADIAKATFVVGQTANQNPSDAAYLMYTSGSTGLAKAVAGSHRATLNRLQWMWRSYPFNDKDVCCQKTSLSFVDSIWELMGPLLQGVPTVVVSDQTLLNVHRFVQLLEQQQVTRLVLLPSLLSVILDSVEVAAARLVQLNLCVVSGEPLQRSVAEHFKSALPHCRLLNLYGSTEVSADVTALEVTGELTGATLPIGRPISNCQVYIVNSDHQLMPAGAVGEIGVAGAGLSLGYYGSHAGLNQQKFIENPFADGRLYLTGDLGRYLPDGSLEHCGRRDAQLKIRGFRIEPAEIEHVIASFDGVRTALVHCPQEQTLLAYYRVKRDATVDLDALNAYVRSQLPDYMIPRAIMALDDFPRLPNGKINRKALPTPDQRHVRHHVAARTQTEKEISLLWQKVLGGDLPSVLDNFVEVGGSSLSGMRFNAHVHRQFGKMVLPRMLLTGNLAQIAAFINPDDAYDTAGSQHDDPVDSPLQIEPLFFGSSPQRLYGVLHRPTDRHQTERAVLLVPSIGHEYMRLQPSYQRLASELARAGCHVLRFDFYGFGDSEGEPCEASVQQWHSDVRLAADYLLSRSGAKTFTGVGVRLGAPVLLGAEIDSMDQCVLWDPVCSGKPYLEHFDELHRFAMRNLDRYRFRQKKSHRWERFGYTYSESLFAEITALNVVTTGDIASANDIGIQRFLAMPGVQHDHVPDVNLWSDPEQASYVAFAQPVLRKIAATINSL